MGWTDRGSKPCGGEVYRTHPDWLWGTPSLLYSWYQVFPEAKAAGALLLIPTTSNAEVKERTELHIYSSSGTSWPVLGWNLPLFWHKLLMRKFQYHWINYSTISFILAFAESQICKMLRRNNFLLRGTGVLMVYEYPWENWVWFCFVSGAWPKPVFRANSLQKFWTVLCSHAVPCNSRLTL